MSLEIDVRTNDRELIAEIDIIKDKVLRVKPDDFAGKTYNLAQYDVIINEVGRGLVRHRINHDSRFGWPGLLSQALGCIMPTVVETVSMEADGEDIDA